MRWMIRSRHSGVMFAVAASISVASLLWGRLTVPLLTADNLGTPLRVHLGVAVASVLAAVACVSLHSEYHLAEGLSPRGMGGRRLAHCGLVMTVGLVLTGVATATLRDSPGVHESIRNFLLFTGLGLVTIPLVTPRNSWILPTFVAIFYATVGAWLPHNPFIDPAGDGALRVATALAMGGGLVAVGASRFMGCQRRSG